MVQRNVGSNLNSITPSGGSSKSVQVACGFILFVIWLGGWLLIWLVFNRLFYGYQEIIYGRPGEIVIGSNIAMIPELMFAGCINYFLNMFMINKCKECFPRFYDFFNSKNKNYSITPRTINKFNNFIIGLMFVSLFFMFLFSHAYIALANKYIAASSVGFLDNRKKYSYADIKLSKERETSSGTQSWIYLYEFPDGKSLNDLGGKYLFRGNQLVIKDVQEKQKLLGFRISEVTMAAQK